MDFLTLCTLVIEFLVFSCLGWIMEITLKYIQYHHFINRGFLIGPYCPIYGAGVVAVTLLVGGLIGRHGTVAETFLAGFVICGVLEYFTSWYMEKVFHARWWDYSQKPMNLNGRIWIGNLILFGVGSIVIIHWIDPVFFALASGWSPFVIQVAAICIVVLMVSDYGFSHFLMNLVKREIDSQDADNTEEITRQIHAMLEDKSLLVRRIQQAYPNASARPKALMDEHHAAQKAYKAAVSNTKQALKAQKASAAAESKVILNKARTREENAKARLDDIHQRIYNDLH
ncbi:MAG: hypothetical protein PHI94_05875 [Eubacteriaceae bacterium]|nr:hypothetical protein [Eubacteriaceae bacterium]MDD4507651.1 hypothetical protein [Eubacteriaceae bacterium]